MLIALTFAHFSSELLLKEQMIISVKNDAKLIDFSEICQKKSSEIGCFLLIVSWRSFPPKFPVKSADFSKNLPRKSFEIWLFSAKIPQNRPIFLRNLTFFPTKIQRNRPIFCELASENPAKFCFFFHEISEALFKQGQNRRVLAAQTHPPPPEKFLPLCVRIVLLLLWRFFPS